MNQRLSAAATIIQTVGIIQITGCAVHNPDRLKIFLEKHCPTVGPIIGDKGTRDKGETERWRDGEKGRKRDCGKIRCRFFLSLCPSISPSLRPSVPPSPIPLFRHPEPDCLY